MIGSILGDIAGSQYEFSRMRPKDLDWEHCDIFTDKCRFTDDTVTTIATAAAIKENKEKPDFARKSTNSLASVPMLPIPYSPGSENKGRSTPEERKR